MHVLMVAIAAALAAPLAFAQSDNASATAQAATPATPATPATAATPATPATPAEPSAAARKVSWSDLDGDKDGKLSKVEAAPLQSLTSVFDKADADKDGALTPDEYKAYVAANGKLGSPHGS
jgi:hypothetical protein